MVTGKIFLCDENEKIYQSKKYRGKAERNSIIKKWKALYKSIFFINIVPDIDETEISGTISIFSKNELIAECDYVTYQERQEFIDFWISRKKDFFINIKPNIYEHQN
jgi:hypothetical protein